MRLKQCFGIVLPVIVLLLYCVQVQCRVLSPDSNVIEFPEEKINEISSHEDNQTISWVTTPEDSSSKEIISESKGTTEKCTEETIRHDGMQSHPHHNSVLTEERNQPSEASQPTTVEKSGEPTETSQANTKYEPTTLCETGNQPETSRQNSYIECETTEPCPETQHEVTKPESDNKHEARQLSPNDQSEATHPISDIQAEVSQPSPENENEVTQPCPQTQKEVNMSKEASPEEAHHVATHSEMTMVDEHTSSPTHHIPSRGNHISTTTTESDPQTLPHQHTTHFAFVNSMPTTHTCGHTEMPTTGSPSMESATHSPMETTHLMSVQTSFTSPPVPADIQSKKATSPPSSPVLPASLLSHPALAPLGPSMSVIAEKPPLVPNDLPYNIKVYVIHGGPPAPSTVSSPQANFFKPESFPHLYPNSMYPPPFFNGYPLPMYHSPLH